MRFSTNSRTYSLDLPPGPVFTDPAEKLAPPYRLVRVVPRGMAAQTGLAARTGMGRACPYLNRENPQAVMWIFCIDLHGNSRVLEIRDGDGGGIPYQELAADAPQIMRELFDQADSTLPGTSVILKLKP